MTRYTPTANMTGGKVARVKKHKNMALDPTVLNSVDSFLIDFEKKFGAKLTFTRFAEEAFEEHVKRQREKLDLEEE